MDVSQIIGIAVASLAALAVAVPRLKKWADLAKDAIEDIPTGDDDIVVPDDVECSELACKAKAIELILKAQEIARKHSDNDLWLAFHDCLNNAASSLFGFEEYEGPQNEDQ